MTILTFSQSIAALVKVSEGDLRKAITFLQSAARLNVDKEISEHCIIEIAGVSRHPLCPRDAFLLSTKIPHTVSDITDLTSHSAAQVVPPKMIDGLLQICFKGTFEKLEVEVRVGTL